MHLITQLQFFIHKWCIKSTCKKNNSCIMCLLAFKTPLHLLSCDRHMMQDLEDVRSMMTSLHELRGATVEVDMELGPIEECYLFLQRRGIAVHREELERVDSLRYIFKNLQAQAVCFQPFYLI